MEKIIAIRAEINAIKTEIYEKFNISKSWFFENVNKVDEPLVSLITQKERRHKF